MLKILIVDDETIIRQGLQKSFDWSKHDCEVVAVCSNGIDALKDIQIYNPDVVITDIHMPKCNGIELMQTLKETRPDIAIIVLSGYDDFIYAKTALESGAFAYLLKPISFDQLSDTLEKIKQHILKMRQFDELKTEHDNLNIEKQLLRIISSPDTVHKIFEENPSLNGLFSKNFFVVTILGENINPQANNVLQFSLRLNDSLDEIIGKSENRIIKVAITQTNYILTVFINDDKAYQGLLRSLEALLEELNIACPNFKITIGISGIFRGAKYIEKAYLQAKSALDNNKQSTNSAIVDYLQINNNPTISYTMSQGDIEECFAYIRTRDNAQLIDKLSNYFTMLNGLSSVNISIVKKDIQKLAVYMTEYFTPGKKLRQFVFCGNSEPQAAIDSLSNLTEIEAWFNKLAEYCLCYAAINGNNVTVPIVKSAIEYIIENYAENFTMNDVTKKLFISQRHLTRRFKQETGITFNEYLTYFRILKAVELIKSKNLKVYDAAQYVGYNDAKYFCSLFKKITEESELI